jgi:predicted glycosyltransferase
MMQKKVLLYVHDGSGLGHLRRISRIAQGIQERCVTLIVTGQRDALWIIPEECEFVHIPNWDRLIAKKAIEYDKKLWFDLSVESAAKFKSDFFLNIVNAFSPDAIIVDYLPLGKNKELESALKSSPAKKYLVNRGIIDTQDHEEIYTNANQYMCLYDKILIAADQTVIEQLKSLNYADVYKSKINYVGYVIPKEIDIAFIRKKRGIKNNQKWVVCSAGGGKNAEQFLLYCNEIAKEMPDVIFDIILGPRSKHLSVLSDQTNKNISIIKQTKELSLMTASCDIAVINGGYNSTMEAISGGSHIVVNPNQINGDDEQIINAKILSKYYSIKLLSESRDLKNVLSELLLKNNCSRNEFLLDVSGISNICDIIFNDLNINLE